MAWPFLPSLESWAAIALVAEVRPNCSTRTPGCAFCAADTAASGRSMICSACSSVPGSVKFTTTERPSRETVFTRSIAFSGLSISEMPRIAERRPTTSFTAAVTSGSPELLPWMSTCSDALSGNPAALTIMSPRLASPLPAADSSSSLSPTRPPMTVASTTNKTQPRMAVLRCCALHRPALAARLRDFISTCAPSKGGGGRTRTSLPGAWSGQWGADRRPRVGLVSGSSERWPHRPKVLPPLWGGASTSQLSPTVLLARHQPAATPRAGGSVARYRNRRKWRAVPLGNRDAYLMAADGGGSALKVGRNPPQFASDVGVRSLSRGRDGSQRHICRARA